MDFAELSRKVIALYLEGSCLEALDVVATGREKFPDQDSTLTWYEGCLLSVSGSPEQALEVLTAGLDRGLGWHPRALRDPDLDSARNLGGWKSFVEQSAAQVDGWDLDRPQPFIRNVQNSIGTLIALHGGGVNPELFYEDWESATPNGWKVVVPVGDVPMSKSEWAWPFDLETDSLVEAVSAVPRTEPVVMSGFSQGGRLAAKAAWDKDIETTGLILFAAVLSTELWTDSEQCPVPTYVVAGTADGGYEGCVGTATVLGDAGVPVNLDVREGLDHMLPDDFDRTMATALDWILSQ